MTSTTTSAVLAAYRPPVAGYDEMVDRTGALRPHWAHVGQALDGLGLEELARRRAEAARLLDDDGVTYNVYGAPSGALSRWNLDPVPVLLTSAEWHGIESAVVQRADLLNLILADLYGPRELLRRRLLPPELVLGHGGFLRPCDQIRIPGPQQLFTVAADVARDSDGQFWVLADRAQTPSGAGYALQNRSVVSRVFPSLHREAQVHRLAPFFRALRAGLEAVAPPASDEPRIVVLTPGPLSETAFEHALLASRLGYSLVEGSELTFRDGRIWVRSLGRRDPVDVILRRVDSVFCDPLELRPNSQLGVPGLLEACRRGTVTVVNPLGTSALENPGLLPFLPQLAQALLGTQLEMPSIPTWWCGDAIGLDHVLANLDHLVLKPLNREAGTSAVFGWTLSEPELDDLAERISARPSSWVGQAQLALGSVPTLTESGLEARRSVLRTFCVARDDSYLAMPGGLTRVATSGQAVISSQTGALAKDTWVLASEPEKMTGLWLDSSRIVAAVEPSGSMSSRAAENLFWLGRYAERAEDTVRLLRVVHDRRNDFAHDTNPAGTACLRALLVALTEVTGTRPGFAPGGPNLDDPGPELESLALDDRRPGTLAFSVRRLLDATQAVRDQLSLDTWLVISGLHRELLDQPTLGRGTLAQVLGSLLALAGLGAESMVRDPGWRFMDAGRRIERGAQLAALLRSTVTAEHDPGTESLMLESVLTTAESIITYRRRYRSHAHLETLLDLLLLDPDTPRSLARQLDLLLEDVRALPTAPGAPRVSEAEKHALETSTVLRLADTAALAATSPPRGGDDGDRGRGVRPELAWFLDRVIDGLHATSDAIARANFEEQLPQRSVLTPTDPGAARVSRMFL
jgi:uncharacterized circularly permuted ATP-grasp superfamily protein/uncharacterized alpha-E superfamily protein